MRIDFHFPRISVLTKIKNGLYGSFFCFFSVKVLVKKDFERIFVAKSFTGIFFV